VTTVQPISTAGSIQTGRVTTEGDTLFYEVRGAGLPGEKPVLLMIAPGGGDGWQYSYVADILADEYKVITFDRRANGRSTMNSPVNFEISQQSRDAVAVLRAAGEEKAILFGNSSGAVIALDMASTQPQAVLAVVAHEAPVPRVLPDAKKWQRFFAGVYATGFQLGPSMAALRFMLGIKVPVGLLIKATKGINLHREQSAEPYLSNRDATEILVKHELLPVTNYLPDFQRIQANGVRVVIAVGQWGAERKTWYVRAAQIMAAQLGCELVTFPGHHGSFMDMPEAFATALRDVLKSIAASPRD
jgi:pimeloyl-ACP methyl ester carboxylesterase